MSAQPSCASRIIAASRIVDGTGSLASLEEKWVALKAKNIRLAVLTIDPLEAGWSTPVQPNHFRSGCAPIEALAHADNLIRSGQADAVLIRGEDFLRSRYADNKSLRAQQMAIYGDKYTIPEAYNLLARAFMARYQISPEAFKAIAAALYENEVRTAKNNNAEGNEEYSAPRPAAFEFVTELFRGVDCANPVVDFSGAIIVASSALADGVGVGVLGVGLAQTSGDGPEYVEELANYSHLRRAYAAACDNANVDIAKEFVAGRLLLEAYTCFPVVPLAFLLETGIAPDIAGVLQLLQTHPITVTGGMNIARAAWNNPCLNALIVMVQNLTSTGISLGAVHGNGGLGYRQGVAILQS